MVANKSESGSSNPLARKIIQWANGRPRWQQDALRRIFDRVELDESDIAEIADLCRQDHGIEPALDREVTFDPISEADFPLSNPGSGAVALTSIEDVRGINRLKADTRVPFAAKGLNILYGDNGSGKTGFVRILKQLCRTRGRSEKILGDAYSDAPVPEPAATIKFTVGDQDRSTTWNSVTSASDALRAISIFDSDSADIPVGSRHSVAYTPAGLDLFPKLVNVCDSIREIINQQRTAIQARLPALPELPPETTAGKLLLEIDASTDPSTVRLVSALNPHELEELKRLKERTAIQSGKLAPDLQKNAAATVGRISEIRGRLDVINELLGDTGIRKLGETAENARIDAKTASDASQKIFTGEPLDRIGSESWIGLWEAAQKYSELHAYPGKHFPVSEAGTVCVLCQQSLGSDAVSRFRRFEDFVQGAVQRKAKQTADQFEAGKAACAGLTIPLVDDAAIKEISASDIKLGRQIANYIGSALERKSLIEKSTIFDFPSLPPMPETPMGELDQLATASIRRHDELSQLSDGMTDADSNRLAELSARTRLNETQATILDHISKLAEIQRLDSAYDATNTAQITAMHTRLAKKLVSDVLISNFEHEMDLLEVRSIDVRLASAGGAKGELRHQLGLRGAKTKSTEVTAIASEGEHRVMALAAFLAEVATAQEKSSIILDDPVSSLDQRYRRKITERLAQEAGVRQVIVFTHDPAFLLELTEAAADVGISPTYGYLRNTSSGAGVYDDEMPWLGLTPKKQIGWLKNELQENRRSFDDPDGPEWHHFVERQYSRLRSAWERSIEQVLLGGAVSVAQREIQTKRLKPVDIVVPDDYETIDRGMSKCSKWLGGHVTAPALGDPLPSPNEISNDISDLEAWINEINERRARK